MALPCWFKLLFCDPWWGGASLHILVSHSGYFFCELTIVVLCPFFFFFQLVSFSFLADLQKLFVCSSLEFSLRWQSLLSLVAFCSLYFGVLCWIKRIIVSNPTWPFANPYDGARKETLISFYRERVRGTREVNSPHKAADLDLKAPDWNPNSCITGWRQMVFASLSIIFLLCLSGMWMSYF